MFQRKGDRWEHINALVVELYAPLRCEPRVGSTQTRHFAVGSLELCDDPVKNGVFDGDERGSRVNDRSSQSVQFQLKRERDRQYVRQEPQQIERLWMSLTFIFQERLRHRHIGGDGRDGGFPLLYRYIADDDFVRETDFIKFVLAGNARRSQWFIDWF